LIVASALSITYQPLINEVLAEHTRKDVAYKPLPGVLRPALRDGRSYGGYRYSRLRMAQQQNPVGFQRAHSKVFNAQH
jgi:hypothetical protein